jgi:AraC-like DNA-binding protein
MARLRLARDVGEFVRKPLGAAVLVETNFIWCASPTLAGTVGWGRPTGTQAERVMTVCDTLFHETLGPQLDIILDGSQLDEVKAAVAVAIFEWARRNFAALRTRIRRQFGVPPPGVGGILLSGMLPMLGDAYPFRIVPTPEAAFRLACDNDGDALREEVAEHVRGFNQVPPLVGELRTLLRGHGGKLTIDEAARRLGRSPRTLQRDLEAVGGTSFRDEQARARLAAIAELLAASDDKIATIAGRVGLSAGGLNRLIRDRIGTTVDAWRQRLRGRRSRR